MGSGDDLRLVGQGVKGTGTAGTTKGGIVPTAAGLLFATAADRKVHVYDSDSGKQLWELPLGAPTVDRPPCTRTWRPTGSFLVTAAAAGGGRGGAPNVPAGAEPTGIVAYALPRN